MKKKKVIRITSFIKNVQKTVLFYIYRFIHCNDKLGS